VIHARALEKRYDDKRILRGVTFDVASDGFLLVTGPKSAGDSASSGTSRSSTAS
jgi:ABC-type multidrug transport system ATPase subunit